MSWPIGSGFSEPSSDMSRPQPHRRLRLLVVSVIVVMVVAVAMLAVISPFDANSSRSSGGQEIASVGSLYTVSRKDLSSQTEVSATLGYAGRYTVVNQATGSGGSSPSGGTPSQGIYTELPNAGQVVSEGQVLYAVSGDPVVLLYGTTPAYRTLSKGATDSATSGGDVEDLNYDLVALGYLNSTEIASEPSDFTASTEAGVEKLQAALGVTQSGTLALGQVVFLPSAARVTSLASSAVPGGPAQAGATVLLATSTTRQVSIALDAAMQTEVSVGNRVGIVLPNTETTPGVIASVGTAATVSLGNSGSGDNSTPTVPVLVMPSDPPATGSWDQAPVNVTITTATVHHVLAVPITALVALAGGGYAVEVVGPNGLHHLVGVSLGVADQANGLVQVSGSALAAGQRVVVPTQ